MSGFKYLLLLICLQAFLVTIHVSADDAVSEQDDEQSAAPPFDRRMLEALVCPVTRGMLVWDAERHELISRSAGYAFPVREGIPIMLIDEARRLED